VSDLDHQGPDEILDRRLNRRRFLGLSAATGVGLILVACGDDDDDGSDTSAAAPATSAPAESAPATSAAATTEAATSEAATSEAATTAAAGGETPATRAIAGLQALGLPDDFTITVFSEDLSILAAEVTKDKFEQESGLKLDIQKSPFLEYAAKVLNDATTKGGAYDVVLMETNRMGDLDNAGYLTDLTEYVAKYNPDIEDMIAPQAQVWSLYNGKFIGIPTDGDVFMFYYRKDKLEDPAEQEAFQAKYGRELAVPTTYDEYREVMEFFTRPDDNFYGAAEWRVKGVTYWWFWQRLWSNGGTYFNDDMTPAINTPEGVKALEDLKDLNQFMPPDVLSFGYVETVAAMSNGTVFSNITWPAAAKNVSDPENSQTSGMWGYATVPGYAVDGSPNPKSMSAPGYSLIVNANSDKDKEALYLYTQWLTSPENLILANKNPAGNTDVIRESIFSDPSMQGAFPGDEGYLDAQKANLAQAVPDPILPGYTEYTQALEIEISEFMTGGKSAQEALDSAAEQWEQITEGFGRESQQAVWQAFVTAYGQTA
jgi:multiple sugar transport system substrate-binding protein